jgi:hypothetical protein
MKVRLISATVAVAGVFALGCFVGQATADQQHMKSAIGYLRGAREQLQQATPNKGGHRERAIQLVDRAIDETRAGIEYAASH